MTDEDAREQLRKVDHSVAARNRLQHAREAARQIATAGALAFHYRALAHQWLRRALYWRDRG